MHLTVRSKTKITENFCLPPASELLPRRLSYSVSLDHVSGVLLAKPAAAYADADAIYYCLDKHTMSWV